MGIFRKHRSDKPINERQLYNKPYLVVTDPRSNRSEYVTYVERCTLYTTPIKEKAFKGETYKEYEDECDRCEKAFPDLEFIIYREDGIPYISRLPEIEGVVSRPLGEVNR